MEKATSQPDSVGRAPAPVPDEMAVVGAALVPLVVCGLLGQLLPALANTSSALILVLVIVAAACTGYRSAGVLAAISAGVWFDFFLTAPYLRFSVASAADVETLIVLVALGVVINEIVQWGRRYHSQFRDSEAYVRALLSMSDADGRHGKRVLDAVSRRLMTMLDLDACRWVDVVDPKAPGWTRMGRYATTADGSPSTPTGSRPPPPWPCRYGPKIPIPPASY